MGAGAAIGCARFRRWRTIPGHLGLARRPMHERRHFAANAWGWLINRPYDPGDCALHAVVAQWAARSARVAHARTTQQRRPDAGGCRGRAQLARPWHDHLRAAPAWVCAAEAGRQVMAPARPAAVSCQRAPHGSRERPGTTLGACGIAAVLVLAAAAMLPLSEGRGCSGLDFLSRRFASSCDANSTNWHGSCCQPINRGPTSCNGTSGYSRCCDCMISYGGDCPNATTSIESTVLRNLADSGGDGTCYGNYSCVACLDRSNYPDCANVTLYANGTLVCAGCYAPLVLYGDGTCRQPPYTNRT